MLVLKLKPQGRVWIGDTWVKNVGTQGISIGIEAPQYTVILREENRRKEDEDERTGR